MKLGKNQTAKANGDNPVVNSPNHYADGQIETIDYCEDKLDTREFVGACKFNVLKYTSRAGKKEDTPELVDLKKSYVYLGWAIEKLEHEEQLLADKEPTAPKSFAEVDRNKGYEKNDNVYVRLAHIPNFYGKIHKKSHALDIWEVFNPMTDSIFRVKERDMERSKHIELGDYVWVKYLAEWQKGILACYLGSNLANVKLNNEIVKVTTDAICPRLPEPTDRTDQ